VREDIVAAREAHLRQFRDAGMLAYPTWHGRTHSAADVHAQVKELVSRGTPVTVAGRLTGKRGHGGSTFLDLRDASGKVQVLLRKNVIGDASYALTDALDLGDILAASGSVQKTKAGEDTVEASSWTLLAKSLLPLPDKKKGLRDVEQRARSRELDLIVNEDATRAFRVRHSLLTVLRSTLAEQGFVEVETPVLQPVPGGASARPFRTHHNALDLDLYLRVSPELYLKRLVVGGLERVYEIARNFRNEGIDRQHNPEFTMCELYMGYATVDDLLPLTESIITRACNATRGALAFSYSGKTIDFTPPWPQIRFAAAIKKEVGIDIRRATTPDPYLAALKKRKIAVPAVHSVPILLDELYREVVRKKIWDPVIVRDFPVEMEPLAKRHDADPTLVQRVQLIAAGMELLKAYTELNDPQDQEERFHEQESRRQEGDDEAQRTDSAFLGALRIGLPPTAGWGMGIDRLAMILADQSHIRDVIAFPLFRPVEPNERS
jgi:lysyl-tRNA synthetase, class II